MDARAPRLMRTLEVFISSVPVVLAGLSLVRGRVGVALGCLGAAAFVVLCFELRFWGHRRALARVRSRLAEVGRRDLDLPVEVSDQPAGEFVEEIAANPALARMLAAQSKRMCVAGTWRGRKVEMGTAVVADRDRDRMISYVCVMDEGTRGPFRVMTKGAMTSFSRATMATHRVATGDDAFDARWVVDGDEGLVRTVLDPSLRSSLVELQERLAWMQVASIEATRFGLVVRWPGELSPDGAAYLRDLAFSVHDRLARPERGKKEDQEDQEGRGGEAGTA